MLMEWLIWQKVHIENDEDGASRSTSEKWQKTRHSYFWNYFRLYDHSRDPLDPPNIEILNTLAP